MIKIENFLEKYIKKNEKIILACSTGPDSMFLLYKILETHYKKNLIVCYFNHKTRPETDIEEQFILKLGEKKGFKVETTKYDFQKIKKYDSNKSFETLAREKRYQFFEKIGNIYKTNKIITAHHLDDKIETFFFNLVRGTKLSGLINMTECSHFLSFIGTKTHIGGQILRPLLNLEKSEILKYLKEKKLKYFIDKTNLDINITRNYFRHEIIPKFKNINKNYRGNLSNLLYYFENIKKYIDEEIEDFLQKFSDGVVRNCKYFGIKEFNEKNLFMQKEIIRYVYFISNGNSTIGLSEANIKEIIKFINGKNNKTIKEIKGLEMKKDGNKILFG